MAKKHITLEKKTGFFGSKFKADLEIIDDKKVIFVKGYVEGFKGMTFEIGNQAIGFGISNFEYWTTENQIESEKEEINYEIITTVHASYDIIFLIIKLQKKIEIGSIPLEKRGPRISCI